MTCFDFSKQNKELEYFPDKFYYYGSGFRIEKQLLKQIHASRKLPVVNFLIQSEVLNNTLVTEISAKKVY